MTNATVTQDTNQGQQQNNSTTPVGGAGGGQSQGVNTTQGNDANQPVTYTKEQFDNLQAELTKLQSANETLAEHVRKVTIQALPADQRAAAEKLFSDLEKQAEQQDQSTQLEDRARSIRAREVALDYKEYGVTADTLKDAKTEAEMEVIALRAKADFLQNNNGGTKPANPGTTPSDKGGANGGGGQGPSLEGVKGRDGVASYLGEVFRSKRGG